MRFFANANAFIFSAINSRFSCPVVSSRVVHCVGLCIRSSYLAGSNPAEDSQGYELFREIALKINHFFRRTSDL